jgi:hypothetical protein
VASKLIYVDDFKTSHAVLEVVTGMMRLLNGVFFGKEPHLTITHEKLHVYLGAMLNYSYHENMELLLANTMFAFRIRRNKLRSGFTSTVGCQVPR